MRNFFDKFFDEHEEEKITEKKMTARAISTVAVMVACLIAMTMTAYAYFSYNVTSQFATIRTANFETKITVQEVADANQTVTAEAATVAEDVVGDATETPAPSGEPTATAEPAEQPVFVITSDHKAHKVEGLKAGKTYEVTITPTEMNTAEHGFVIFAAYHTDENGKSTLASPVYHTQQLGVDVSAPNGRTDVISFNLQLDADADVIFYSHWGTSSYYGYANVVPFAEGQEVKDLYVEQGETIKMEVTGATLEDELLPTPTPIPELTPTPMPEGTPTPIPEATSTPAPTGEPTAEPTETIAPESTEAPTSAPEATSEPVATEAPIVTPTEAPVAEPTPAPVVTPTEAPVDEPIMAPIESSGSETTGEATSSEVSEQSEIS